MPAMRNLIVRFALGSIVWRQVVYGAAH